MQLNRVVATALVLLASHANAGFLTGVAVGAALNSGSGGSSVPQDTVLLTSDKYDVIACAQGRTPGTCREYDVPVRNADGNGRGGVFDNPGLCNARVTQSLGGRVTAELTCTPQQFAVNSGYKTVHKVSTAVVNGFFVLVMEVSK